MKEGINPGQILELITKGYSAKDLAKAAGCSINEISSRIADIRDKVGIVTEYRKVQSTQLTELQFMLLECITPEKLADASLKDIMTAFNILKDKEFLLEGKPTEIHGLASYLLEIEAEDKRVKELKVAGDDTVVEGEFSVPDI